MGEKEVSQKSGKEYPRETDYFVLVDAPKVAEVYGDKPREIDIIFPVNDPLAIADTCYMAYGQTGWKCRGNGEIAYNRESDNEIECLGEDCRAVQDKKCKRQMRLTFVCFKVPGLCVYDLVTSGWRSIENTLAFLETLNDLFGRVDGIPLKLLREPYETSYTDESGKTHKQVHHCIRLDVAASLLDVKRLQLGGGQMMELPEAPAECADDQYPASIQGTALNPTPEIVEVEVIPASEPVPVASPAAVEPDIPPEIQKGFDILQISLEQRAALLSQHKGEPEKLLEYLSAKVDSALGQTPEPTGTNGKGWSF